MARHVEVTAREAADRLAIRELFDAYARCADRRDADGQMALFTEDTHFVVHLDGEGTSASSGVPSGYEPTGRSPSYALDGRQALAPVFADLNRYEATTHFNGQQTVELQGDTATAESYTLAHHVFTEGGQPKLMLAALRYRDTAVRVDGEWLFAERILILDWSETRPISG